MGCAVRLKAPVFTDLPFGHVPTKVCLPVGTKVSLVVEDREALILWAHQRAFLHRFLK
jgi:muramoyltetrapeptide carboxypeptidase